MKVNLFIPCFIDQLYPQTAMNALKLLQYAGADVHYNPEQTCCGQPAFNSGYWDEAKSLALKFLDDFNEEGLVVSPSASCTGYVKNHYARLFADDPILLQRFAILKPRLYELTDFLVNVLKVESFGAIFPHRVTFHDACSALREYKLGNEPRKLLGNVTGLDLVEMEESHTCCGFGGTFSAKHTTISSAMTQQKVEFALAAGAEYIVSTEASCLMNITAYAAKNKIAVKTIHIADILANRI